MARVEHQRQVELQLAPSDGQHRLVLGGGRDTLPSLSVPTSVQSMLWIGNYSRQWEVGNYSQTKPDFQMLGSRV